jgi:hypothetical protein
VGHSYRSGADLVYQPKPSYLSAKTFLQFFGGYLFERRVPAESDDDFVLTFSNGKEQRLAVWTASRTHRLTIRLEPGSYAMTKHTGEDAGEVRSTRTGLSLEVRPRQFTFAAGKPTLCFRTELVIVDPLTYDPSNTTPKRSNEKLAAPSELVAPRLP